MVFFHNKRSQVAVPAVYFCILNPPGVCMVLFNGQPGHGLHVEKLLQVRLFSVISSVVKSSYSLRVT